MTRVELASALTPEQALGWLVSDDRPFALSGDWFGLGGVTILGSEPVRVGDPRHDDPFGLIAEANSDSSDAAVGGGWVGWLGYGLGAEIEALLPPPPPAVPRPRWSLAFYDHVVIHDGERWFFESLTERPDRLDLWRQRLSTEPPPFPEAEPPALAPTGSGGSGHIAAVTELLERIAAGDLYQANLCMRLAGRYSGDPLALFADGLSAGRPRFGACVDGVVSLSPERFLRRHGRNVKTEPIKGTRPLTASAEELAGSAKDAAEHVMIVDLMRNDLGRVCEYGSIFAEPPRVEPHAGVLQLVSTVSGRLRADVDDGALLRAAFPPGSVTGAPKVAAMEAITELEAVRREAYTGAVGIVSPTAGLDLNVAIRT
ncbi:MAG: chorismate-binding protein, partial [Solirubrobacterales bacterium]|nr:chorismate-binding protein [Solirubrobacterales bacterium]